LIVMNTKTCAEKTYEVLKKSSESKKHIIFYLSTNLCTAHRKKIIKVMKRFLKQGKSVICVSTQLIEAGVDISFEGIVRHLAGLDSVAQATGRGNRHGEGEIKYSYIINLTDENLGSLKEIELGEKHTAEILYEYGKDAERFENDLLSPTAIKRYYKYYYADKNIEELMDFPVKVKAGTAEREAYIYNMLSGAVPNKISYKDKYGEACELSLNFMFETAGNNFKVIDDLTTSVLVPYGKGKKIIADLFSSKSFSDKIEKLKLAQQYSVNIYKNQKDRLISENALVLSEIPGIYVLKDGYYDKTLGIVTEKTMGLLLA
jgi:CRISPR-associated endonuclease/helicase Cas3